MKSSGKKNFLIDGFPRNKDNVDGWEAAMNGKVHVLCVLFFDCNEQVEMPFLRWFKMIPVSCPRRVLHGVSSEAKRAAERTIMQRV